MYRFKDGTIWYSDYDFEKNGERDGAVKLDEDDTAAYTYLLKIAMGGEKVRRHITEDQLLEITFLSKQETGLPVNICLDWGNTFERQGKRKVIKFQKDTSSEYGEDWLPIAICKKPKVINLNENCNLTSGEIKKIEKFVRLNHKILKRLGKRNFGTFKFLDKMKRI